MKKLFCILFLCFLNLSFSQNQFSVFFDSNKFELKKSEIDKLNLWITQNPKIKIIGANGFCDEDGTSIANDTLAKRRIQTVYNYLKNKIQIRTDFKFHAFGELHQLSKIKAENRKVTLFFIESKDFSRENEILGIKPITIAFIKKPKIVFDTKMILNNPDGSSQEIVLDTVFMQKVNLAKKGEVLNIKNLNFIINTFIIIPESRVKMHELLVVMQKNPTLKIEIQGHLCCNVEDKKNLSGLRAKAILGFLENNGIDKPRMTFVGFGGKKPLFTIPETSEYERASNRRVEILILEN
jgi:outer membrane protein OmpA-like peptidoglycan-associated protein